MKTALEQVLTNSYKDNMISYVASHPDTFEELILLAISDKQPYSWRATWLLWSCMEENDTRIRRYMNKIIKIISARDDNQQWELLKILQKMEIPEEFEGILFNHCVTVWEVLDKKPAVRFNAFKMMLQIAKRHPVLFREIKFLTQSQYMDSLSPGARKSISKILNKLHLNAD